MYNKAYYEKNREKVKAKAKEYYVKNRERNRVQREELRRQALEFYSNGELKCACCGEITYEFLEIDHINNNGAEMRKQDINHVRIYSWLKKYNYPEGFQVLCCNCNWAKHRYGICPHQKLKGETIGTSDCAISSRLA
jgi:hypothetical protein